MVMLISMSQTLLRIKFVVNLGSAKEFEGTLNIHFNGLLCCWTALHISYLHSK